MSRELSLDTGVPYNLVKEVMQSYCHLIYRKLANGEEVRVDGVGTLFLKFRKGRSWKCSFNEEMTTTPDTYYLSVRGSSILREALGELYDSGEGPVPQKPRKAPPGA